MRVLEALTQAPVPEACSRRMDPGQEHLPIERLPPIGRRSAPGEVGYHRLHSILAVRREPSGLKWSEHGMVLRASTRMLVRPGGSSTHLGSHSYGWHVPESSKRRAVRTTATAASPGPSQSLWACHPNSRNSSKSLNRPLRILYNATHGCFLDSNPRILCINSRAVPRGRLDRIVRFRCRIHKYSCPAHHSIAQRIARRFFDDNIDPHWSILLQPTILRHRDHHLHRRHRRAFRLHGVWPTDDPQRIWHSAFPSNLNTQLSLLLHWPRMGFNAGLASL